MKLTVLKTLENLASFPKNTDLPILVKDLIISSGYQFFHRLDRNFEVLLPLSFKTLYQLTSIQGNSHHSLVVYYVEDCNVINHVRKRVLDSDQSLELSDIYYLCYPIVIVSILLWSFEPLFILENRQSLFLGNLISLV